MNQDLLIFIVQIMSIQINKKEDSTSFEYYQELNRYLQKDGNDNQNLYQFLQKAKRESIIETDTNIQADNLKHIKAYQSMFSVKDQLNYYDYVIDQNQPPLKKTEDRIFQQVSKLMFDIHQLEAQLKKENKKVQALNNHLDLLRSNSHAYLCQSAQRQQQLIIKDSEIDEVKKEIEEIQKRADLIKILNQDIQPLLEQQQQQNQELKRKHQVNEKEKYEAQQILKTIQQLEKQVRQLSKSQCQQERGTKNENSSQYEDQIIECLQERLQIEQYLQNQQKQKQQFMKALEQFKQKYQQVKKTNKSLKDSLQMRGIDYSFISSEKAQL